jgi:carboxyl-terminal processing protease
MNKAPKLPILTHTAKGEILDRILEAISKKFYKPELLTPSWDAAIVDHRPLIEKATTPADFEKAVARLLSVLKTSHFGFFHGSARRASSRAALSATYLEEDTEAGKRWVFQNVHSGGAAALACVSPGDVLLAVNGEEISPPEHPVFAMGDHSRVEVLAGDGERKTVTMEVAQPKGKKLHFIEPTLVEARQLEGGIGYLKIAMFPGTIGVDVANQISKGVAQLGEAERLIIDLRGNTGGGIGALRVMSMLTPLKIPVGFSPGKKWAGRDLEASKNSFTRFDRVPATKGSLWLLALRYFPTLVRKSPVVLETEGLGYRSFHGKIALLVDRHTASAAEMIVAFARENHLATIVGESTAGRLLSATSVKVGHGYRLALPTGAYHTWQGTVLEGTPIEPDVEVKFDWQRRRAGIDEQLDGAVEVLRTTT